MPFSGCYFLLSFAAAVCCFSTFAHESRSVTVRLNTSDLSSNSHVLAGNAPARLWLGISGSRSRFKQSGNVRFGSIPLKNSKIFRANFSANIDFCRMFEVNTMPTLTGDFPGRYRRHSALPLFVEVNNSLTVLIFSGLDQKRSFSTESAKSGRWSHSLRCWRWHCVT